MINFCGSNFFFFPPFVDLIPFTTFNSTVERKVNYTAGKSREQITPGFRKEMPSIIMSQTFNFSSFSKTTLQLLALWQTVDLIFVKNFLFHCFILINVNPNWLISITEPFLFVIFSTILFIFAFVDIVSFTIIRLALLKYAQLSVIKGENLLVMKLIYILNNLCRQ